MRKLCFLDRKGNVQSAAQLLYLLMIVFRRGMSFAGIKSHIKHKREQLELGREKMSQLSQRAKEGKRILSSGNAYAYAVAVLYHIIFFNCAPHSAQQLLKVFNYHFYPFFHKHPGGVHILNIKYAFLEAVMAYKVYIDQGHNPQNPNAGAEGNGYREQDLTYEIGRLTALYLEELGVEAKLSRPTPEAQLGSSIGTSLQARVSEANAWGADYFISLHANASDITSASGSEAYVFSSSSAAYPLAEDILKWLNISTGLPNRGVFSRPSLYVLRRTAMPATLIELGFITNPYDAALMAERPDLFANGVANGIVDFLGIMR